MYINTHSWLLTKIVDRLRVGLLAIFLRKRLILHSDITGLYKHGRYTSIYCCILLVFRLSIFFPFLMSLEEVLVLFLWEQCESVWWNFPSTVLWVLALFSQSWLKCLFSSTNCHQGEEHSFCSYSFFVNLCFKFVSCYALIRHVTMDVSWLLFYLLLFTGSSERRKWWSCEKSAIEGSESRKIYMDDWEFRWFIFFKALFWDIWGQWM